MLLKTKSFRPSKTARPPAVEPPKLDLSLCKPANEQDEDEDFQRAESNDSDEDYDGVPDTEEVPMIVQVVPDTPKDKMEITLEQNSNSIEQEMLDLP